MIMADSLVPNICQPPRTALSSFGQRDNPEDQSLRFGVERSRIDGEHGNLPFGDVVVVSPHCQALEDGTDMGCAGLRSDAQGRRACPCFQAIRGTGRTRADGARYSGQRAGAEDSNESHDRSQVGGREQQEQSQAAVPGASEGQEQHAGGCACVPRSLGGIPMSVTSAYSHRSRFLPWVGGWKQATAPGATGAVAICGGNGSQPPGRMVCRAGEACRHESHSRYRSAGTIVIRRIRRDAVQAAHGISAN